MAKSQYSEQQIQERMARGVSRKSAIQFLRRQGKKSTPAPVAKKVRKGRSGKPFDTEKAVALYAKGITVPNIAVELGYKKGQGQNRTRAALRAAGVYKERK